MHDASLPLQAALVARLRAALPALAGRVHDRAPPEVAFPFVQFGASQSVPEAEGCLDLATCHLTLHVWSRAVGAVEARGFAAAIAAALTDWTPELTGVACDDLRVTSIQIMADPDGLTTHGVVQVEAFTARI